MTNNPSPTEKEVCHQRTASIWNSLLLSPSNHPRSRDRFLALISNLSSPGAAAVMRARRVPPAWSPGGYPAIQKAGVRRPVSPSIQKEAFSMLFNRRPPKRKKNKSEPAVGLRTCLLDGVQVGANLLQQPQIIGPTPTMGSIPGAYWLVVSFCSAMTGSVMPDMGRLSTV